MKKTIAILGFAFSTLGFISCGDGNANKEDSVENAQDVNEDKKGMEEDASDFMTKAASGGMMEVQLGQLAQQKAQHSRVKAFGAMMVEDHTKANEELKALAAQNNVTLPQTMSEDHQKHVTELSEKTGKEFDEAYMEMMVKDHKEDIDHFKEAADDVKNPAIQGFAQKTLPVLQKHLDSAQAIKDAVD